MNLRFFFGNTRFVVKKIK